MTWRRAALRSASPLALASTANAQAFSGGAALSGMLADVAWWSVTIGAALAAIAFGGLLVRSRRDERLTAAERRNVSLRTALDRTVALLDADDQRTIVRDGAVGEPDVSRSPRACRRARRQDGLSHFRQMADRRKRRRARQRR
jgi:hypothetical protein